MHTNDPKDPLEGKGGEMIPDQGIPFDDVEDSAPRDSPTLEMGEPDSPNEALPFTDEHGYTPPPEDLPDEGMRTALEEADTAGEVPPELQDGGMSAGYPPIRDEDLLSAPSVPVVEPEPSSMSGAPLFSAETLDLPSPIGGETPTQEEEQTAQT